MPHQGRIRARALRKSPDRVPSNTIAPSSSGVVAVDLHATSSIATSVRVPNDQNTRQTVSNLVLWSRIQVRGALNRAGARFTPIAAWPVYADRLTHASGKPTSGACVLGWGYAAWLEVERPTFRRVRSVNPRSVRDDRPAAMRVALGGEGFVRQPRTVSIGTLRAQEATVLTRPTVIVTVP